MKWIVFAYFLLDGERFEVPISKPLPLQECKELKAQKQSEGLWVGCIPHMGGDDE